MGRSNPVDAWTDVKGLIDAHWKQWPRHQGTVDTTEVIEYPQIAESWDLTDKQYDALIDKGQAYFNMLLSGKKPKAKVAKKPVTRKHTTRSQGATTLGSMR